MIQGQTWTEKHNRYPSKCEGYWRWTLPDSEYHDAPDLLPSKVFNALESREKFPWLFQSVEDAFNSANLAANKVGNPSLSLSPKRFRSK